MMLLRQSNPCNEIARRAMKLAAPEPLAAILVEYPPDPDLADDLRRMRKGDQDAPLDSPAV
jgi:hypothetical protein